MRKIIPQKDYGTCERNVQLLIDESFAEKVIPADDSVRLLDKIVEEMDLRALMRAYNSHGRPPATPPRTMLKIVLYAYMEHNLSSRKIKSCCERDIHYIWLLDGEPAPSHFEIARFRSQRLGVCAKEIFHQLVTMLQSFDSIGGGLRCGEARLQFSPVPFARTAQGYDRDAASGNELQHKQTACQDSAKPNRHAVV